VFYCGIEDASEQFELSAKRETPSTREAGKVIEATSKLDGE